MTHPPSFVTAPDTARLAEGLPPYLPKNGELLGGDARHA